MLDAVEVGGLRCTGRCLPLRAFENRVYEVELEDERRLVIKFHRPGRWSKETILDEHAFLAELAAAEIPVVPPLDLGTGTTLGQIDGIFYSVFPKVRGRIMDELDAERWARDALVFALPQKILCGPECAGLCPRCGVRLEQGGEHRCGEDDLVRADDGPGAIEDLRAKGMTLMRMPLTCWSWFITAILGLLAFGVLLSWVWLSSWTLTSSCANSHP